MAWRPYEYLIEGELDNTVSGRVTGWMRFSGFEKTIMFDLEGNFHRDIRGTKIHLSGNGFEDDEKARKYMHCFSSTQTGKVGDITAGLPPQDYVSYPYIEWYGDENGRVVIELEPDQIRVIGEPIPTCESDPVSRQEQAQNMIEFLRGLTESM